MLEVQEFMRWVRIGKLVYGHPAPISVPLTYTVLDNFHSQRGLKTCVAVIGTPQPLEQKGQKEEKEKPHTVLSFTLPPNCQTAKLK